MTTTNPIEQINGPLRGRRRQARRPGLHPPQRNDLFSAIAHKVMDIETLETRQRDRLDFHDVAVWSIQEALDLAFQAGQRIAEGERPNNVLRDLRK